MPISKSLFFFGNSLVNFAEGGAQTNVPFWLGQFASASGNSVAAQGGYGFLTDFADREEPNADWGFDGIRSIYDSETTSFAEAAIDTVVINPANFLQTDSINTQYPMDPRTPLEAASDIVSDVQASQPSANIYLYEGWADMGPFFDEVPESSDSLSEYHGFNTGAYHNWYVSLADGIESSVPGATVTLIPVASVISDLLTSGPLSELSPDELYVDSAPHGTETLYFLAAMTTYTAVYGETPPADLEIPDTIHPVVAANYVSIANQIPALIEQYDGFQAVATPAEETPEETEETFIEEPVRIAQELNDDGADGGGIVDDHTDDGTDGEPDHVPTGEGAVITRTITVDDDGVYLFELTSDEAVTLIVDGEEILFHPGDEAEESRPAYIELGAGDHEVVISYSEADGGETLVLDFGPAETVQASIAKPWLPETEFEDIPEEKDESDYECEEAFL